MTERAGESGWMNSLEAGYRGAKAIRKDRSQDGGSNGTTWAISLSALKKCKSSAERGLRGAKEMYEENIISAVIHVDL